jgi:structural maintenance of chromosome 2
VKGVAAQLISLPEEHYPKATALEIAGGGKLFNVVIEDELVGKDLIKNGNMKKRVTFIPLSKIDPRTLDPKACNSFLFLFNEMKTQLFNFCIET